MNVRFPKWKTIQKIHLPALLAGLVFLIFSLGLTAVYQIQRSREDRLQMEYIAQTIQAETFETLRLQMDKSRVLEGYLIETGGRIDSFAPIAEGLLEDNPAIQNLLFAPQGVVSAAFPYAGNEATIGLDLNSNGQGNLEAQAAIRAGELFLAGPFELVEGGMGICGRLPIYLEGEYWGLVSVSLSYPAIFAGHPIHNVNDQGFAARLWRINPDTNQKQTILETEKPVTDRMKTVKYSLQMYNADWTLELASLTFWYQRASLWIMVFTSLLGSVLGAYGVELNQELRKMRTAEAEQQIRRLRQQLEWEKTNTMVNQISTHFFYHTLNALQALIILKPDDAYKMAGDFSRYLRFNVDAIAAAGGVVSFREELRAVRAYAEINETQLGDRLKVIFDIPDADFKMPALTLQTLVENAIIHGIKPKVGGGTVTVSLRSDEQNWYIRVADDGQGFDPTMAYKEQSVGLTNIRNRIAAFDGCALEIASAPGCGTTAVLIFRKNLENME